MMNSKEVAYVAALRAQLVSLRARLNCANEFTLNRDLHVERVMLARQIDALSDEADRIEAKARERAEKMKAVLDKTC
ncbi:hypothetical protein BcepF1.035 [Burkholderia phage BcepF1]|uniref:Uncharacterized protein n=1 Tax=Burkholderia phage BcepF1 TaxID=2886897 RepID=A1YZT9_9CAUD|nr:hypothetical protein BcepF1.035 [Burkholderia phage BcepF1]ABL96766.1 hypothetical protein BcepF1.035 [Burkholderia phage BcepF1]